MVWMVDEVLGKDEERGSSPASRGGAGTYIEGELGAFSLLSMLADQSTSQCEGWVSIGTRGGNSLEHFPI